MLGPDLQYTLPALRYGEVAMETAHVGDRDEIEWLLELLRRQRRAEEAKEKGRSLMKEQSCEQLKMPQYTQVGISSRGGAGCSETVAVPNVVQIFILGGGRAPQTGILVFAMYFTSILLRTPESSLYHSSWPSLFIAPAGITSELHVDAFASNFWMALFEGKKR